MIILQTQSTCVTSNQGIIADDEKSIIQKLIILEIGIYVISNSDFKLGPSGMDASPNKLAEFIICIVSIKFICIYRLYIAWTPFGRSINIVYAIFKSPQKQIQVRIRFKNVKYKIRN